MQPSLLSSDGKIPQGQECPFQTICSTKSYGGCHHTGINHQTDFSCGSARGFDICLTEETFAIKSLDIIINSTKFPVELLQIVKTYLNENHNEKF